MGNQRKPPSYELHAAWHVLKGALEAVLPPITPILLDQVL